jgi:hypothetical protein
LKMEGELSHPLMTGPISHPTSWELGFVEFVSMYSVAGMILVVVVITQ